MSIRGARSTPSAGSVNRRRGRGELLVSLIGCAVLLTACGSGAGTAASSAVSDSVAASSPAAMTEASGSPAGSATSSRPTEAEVEKVEIGGSASPSTVEPAPVSTSISEDVPSGETAAQESAPPPSAVADVVDGACAPAEPTGQSPTSTGAVPVEAFVCDFSGTAPGATVTFLRWGSIGDAFSFYQDAAGLGPRIEAFDKWTFNGVSQGPLWTNESDGRTLSTGAYDQAPYTWQISTTTLDESNLVFGKVTLKPASALT